MLQNHYLYLIPTFFNHFKIKTHTIRQSLPGPWFPPAFSLYRFASSDVSSK